ncbi:MAG TPA: alpha/beta hydrolase fold domain-containing protein [Jatrophihabitantaceae bacterium]|jgi:acetyl esterase/lipase|nr:alpha/beta hydrolase fold domain-containing protein [Jatrophihabitantaceae bacterium]
MHLPRLAVVALTGPTYRLSLHHRLSVRMQRWLSEVGAGLLRPPRGTQVEHIELGGRSAERVTVGASHRPRAVLYLHGGGYVVGSARMYRALAGYLARVSGAVVFTLDYRLAPEHVYPAALDDAVAAFRTLVAEHGFDAARIAVAGDSAGGGLAVAAARRLTDDGLRPGALALLSPWTDPSDHDMPLRDFVVNQAWGTSCAELYRGSADPLDPGYAPMHANLRGLPPMAIHTAKAEMLNAQVKRFAARAEAAGGDVALIELPTLWHSGHVLAGLLRESTQAVHDVGTYLRACLDVDADMSLSARQPG